MEFFSTLEPVLRTFWYIAIPTSLIFILQTILTLIGAGDADGIDTDFDVEVDVDVDAETGDAEAPSQWFSFRNLINFLLGFSWSGISFYNLIPNKFLLVVIALNVGLLFVVLFFYLIKQLERLAEDNTFQLTETLNRKGEVYLRIPENKSGRGKILISIRGAVHELDAITEGESIPQSTEIEVLSIAPDGVLLVKPI